MKITKFVHSCLLVEADNKRVLVDPGNFSWQSGTVTPEVVSNIDIVVITHEHPDHLDEVFARAIHQASPEAVWRGTNEVVAQLNKWGIEGFSSSNDDEIRFIESDHADLHPWFKQQPEYVSFVIFNELLIGGDCHTLTESHGARIFAAAINGGPWGAVVGFTKMIEAMSNRPEVVLPLHDWHFNDDARQSIYARLPEVLSDFNVEFVALENGIATQV